MSWTKFSVNAITEGIIRTLRQSDLIRDDVSADVLRNLDNSLTEVQMQDKINQMSLGGEGLGGLLASPDDLVMLIDSDAAPSPWTNNKNYFRIGRAQSERPLDYWTTLASIYGTAPHSGTDTVSNLVIGPDTHQITTSSIPGGPDPNDFYPARLFFGAYTTSDSSARTLGMIATGTNIHSDGSDAFRMHSPKKLEFSSVNPHVAEFTYSTQLFYSGNDSRPDTPSGNPKTLGGFHSGSTNLSVFYVGDRYIDLGTDTDCLVIQRRTNKLCEIINHNFSDSTTSPRPTINLTSYSAQYTGIISVNANTSVTARNPATHGNSALSVFGSEVPASIVTSAISPVADFFGGHVLRLRSYDTIGGDRYHFIYAEKGTSGSGTPLFRVTNEGNVVAAGTITPGGADIAEQVHIDATYEPGTVLCMSETADKLTKSMVVEDPKIVGVVAEKAGVLLGKAAEGKLPMTVCGFNPVNCTTIAGNIVPGDRLVSSTDGKAQKAGPNPKPGTILGKAFEALTQEDDEPKTGCIKTLIILQ